MHAQLPPCLKIENCKKGRPRKNRKTAQHLWPAPWVLPSPGVAPGMPPGIPPGMPPPDRCQDAVTTPVEYRICARQASNFLGVFIGKIHPTFWHSPKAGPNSPFISLLLGFVGAIGMKQLSLAFRKGSHNLPLLLMQDTVTAAYNRDFLFKKNNSKKNIHFLVRCGRRNQHKIQLKSPSQMLTNNVFPRKKTLTNLQPQPGSHGWEGTTRRNFPKRALLIKAMTSGSSWYLPMLPGLLMMSWMSSRTGPTSYRGGPFSKVMEAKELHRSHWFSAMAIGAIHNFIYHWLGAHLASDRVMF